MELLIRAIWELISGLWKPCPRNFSLCQCLTLANYDIAVLVRGLFLQVADDIDGVPVDLSIYRGNVTLVVNVASQ